MAFDRMEIVCVDTLILDIDDLALVDGLSGGNVDLTYGRCVLLTLKVMGMSVY